MRRLGFGLRGRYRSEASTSTPTAPTNIVLSAMDVDENAGLGSFVATVTANGSPSSTFSIVNDPDNKFDISGSNLILDGALDFETATSHEVTIRADNGVGSPHDQLFTINVTDVIEGVAPTDIIVSTPTIAENSPISTVISPISANGTPSPALSIIADPDNKFAIVGTDLVLNGVVDFETATSHSVTIQADNGVGAPYSEAFVIAVTDVDEIDPFIVSTSPTDDATDAPLTGPLVITYDGPVQFGTGNISFRTNDGGFSDVETITIPADIGSGPGQAEIVGNELRIHPTNDRVPLREYSVQASASLIDDLEGNSFAGIADDTTFSFTTAAAAAALQQDWDPLFDEGSDFDIITNKDGGSDLNDGLTLGTAKETVQGGLDALPAGGLLKVRNINPATKYREQVLGAGKGGPDAANKTRIVGFEQEKPEITAAELLTGAVPCVLGDLPIVGDRWANIYKVTGFTTADIAAGNPRGLNMYEDGRRMSPCMTRNALPQFPLSETNTYDWPDWAEVLTTGGVNLPGQILGLRDPELTDQFTQAQIENCDVIFHRDPNGTTRTTIASFDPGTDTITYTDQTRTYEGNDNQNRAVLINCLPAMRRGQWGFVDNGATVDIYFWPYDPAQVNVSIEYSARGNVIDTGDESNFECRSIQMTRASSGNTGVSADGLYNFTSDKSGTTRGSGINLINCRLAEAYRSITGYGLFWIHNMDNCLVENCRLEDGYGMFGFFFHGGLVTSPEGMAENNVLRNSLIQRIDKSPMRWYGQKNFQAIYNRCENSGNEAHANMFAAYESAEYGLFGWNLFLGCSGRAVWQEASNIYLYMNYLPATYTDIDGRAITDQNNGTASPGELNTTNSDCYMIGNFAPAYRNAKLYSNGAVLGTALWTLTNYCAMNNLFNGLVIEPGRDITNGVMTNMLTAGTAFDASDTVVAIEDVFENYVNGDHQIKSTSPTRTAATTSIATLPGTDGPITLASKFPTVDFARDAAGVAFDLTTPPLGLYVNQDALPNHGPFYINEPTLNAMPVVGNDTSANNDHYIQGKPFPAGFDVQWVRSDDQFAIAADWEEIAGQDSDPFAPDAGDVGYFVARRSAPTGTTIYRYSKVNARVIASHPIAAPTLLADFPDPATKAALEWTETGTFTPTGPTLVLFTSFNTNSVQSTITATVGAQGRAIGTGTPIAMDAFILRNTRNQTTFALMPDPAAGPVTIQYQSSDGHFSFLVQILNADGTDSLQFGEASATPTETIEKELKTTVANTSLLFVLNRYSGDFVADPIAWTGATKIAEENTGGTSTSGDLTSSIAYAQGMPKQSYAARATWADNRNIAAVAIGLVPATVAPVTDIMAGVGDFSNPALWTIVKTEAAVVGGVAQFSGTTQSFTRIEIRGLDRVPVAENTELDLSFDVSRMDNEGRLWINVEAFDSGGLTLGSTTIYDSDVEGIFTTIETRTKANAYTTPAGTATLEVSLNCVDIGSDYDIDNLMLTY